MDRSLNPDDRGAELSDFSQVLGRLRQLWPTQTLDPTKLARSYEEALGSAAGEEGLEVVLDDRIERRGGRSSRSVGG